MIEVPEYLLARSRKRRAQLTGEGEQPANDSADPAAATASASEAKSAATPPSDSIPAGAVVSTRPIPPSLSGEPSATAEPAQASDPLYIQAAKTRKKMPAWAASVMACLPFWAIFYVGTLEPPSRDELVLGSNGAIVFSSCASCHGSDGAGTATGRQLNNGEVLLTFPAREDFDGLAHHLSWVYLGTQGYRGLGLEGYGDPERPGGQRQVDSFASGMSGFPNLSLDDLVSVVYYERVTHGGLDPEQAALEEEMLLALAADHPDFETGSPAEIAELLAASAGAHGVGLADTAETSPAEAAAE